MNYLNRRINESLNVHGELDTKVLSLNMLMTAYMDRIAHADIDHGITQKVPGLAKHYANLLVSGKFVVFRGEEDNRTYYVVAHDRDLVAVFQPIGSGFDIYAAYGSSDRVLEQVGITTMSFTDHHILDGLFGWEHENKHKHHDISASATVDVVHGGPLAWKWHQPSGEAHVEEKPAPSSDKSEKKLTDTRVAVTIVEPAGAPESEERKVELSPAEPTAMGRSFQAAHDKQQQQQHHGHGRHSDRRGQPKPETSK